MGRYDMLCCYGGAESGSVERVHVCMFIGCSCCCASTWLVYGYMITTLTAHPLQVVTATFAMMLLAQEVECKEVKDDTCKCEIGECSVCRYACHSAAELRSVHARIAYLS